MKNLIFFCFQTLVHKLPKSNNQPYYLIFACVFNSPGDFESPGEFIRRFAFPYHQNQQIPKKTTFAGKF